VPRKEAGVSLIKDINDEEFDDELTEVVAARERSETLFLVFECHNERCIAENVYVWVSDGARILVDRFAKGLRCPVCGRRLGFCRVATEAEQEAEEAARAPHRTNSAPGEP
jgi:hypothetical protein